MFSLEIQNDILSFKDIRVEHLPQILRWYNMVEDFQYATGIDHPITLTELERKYAEVAICSSEFFVGIYLRKEMNMVGILKGSVKYDSKDSVWVRSLVIDPMYQNYGLGSKSIDLLLGFFTYYKGIKSAYLAVVEDNQQGKRFWERQGFKPVRRIDKHLRLQNRQQNIIIMNKQLQ